MHYPGKPFKLPQQRKQMHAQFWPPRKVAREWGISHGDALRYMLAHPELSCWVRVVRADGRLVWILCLNLAELPWAEGE